MTEISDKELERYKRIEETCDAAAVTLVQIGKPALAGHLRHALEPVHTPLVSDEELRKAYDEAYKGHNFTDALHAIGALYLRKAADKLEEDHDRGVIANLLREWADKGSS